MKTILSNKYQINSILRKEAEQNNGIVQGIRTVPLSAYLQSEQENEAEELMLCRQALLAHPEFAVYYPMFAYPAFVQEILAFAREMIQYEIEIRELPERNAQEKERKQILEVILQLDLMEKTNKKNRDRVLAEPHPDLYLAPYFAKTLYEAESYEKLHAPVLSEETEPESTCFLHALNTRREIEAAAQSICKHNEKTNIILMNAKEQLPVLCNVFARYGIPFRVTADSHPAWITQAFCHLTRFSRRKDAESLANAIESFPTTCSSATIQFLNQTMTEPCMPTGIAEAMSAGPFKQNARPFVKAEKGAQAWFEQNDENISLLLQAESIQESIQSAFTILRKNPLLKKKTELQAAMQLRQDIMACAPYLNNEADLEYFLKAEEMSEIEYYTDGTDFCVVTDASHPVPSAEYSYILGCTGKNYPGFPAKDGLFDEDYLSQISSYPSQEKRFSAYMDQLQWLDHSGRHIQYSYGTNDYQGRSQEAAYELEERFGQAKRMDLITLPQEKKKEHRISLALAQSVFFPNGKVTGSISTIEKWFGCPYAYWIENGLHVHADDPFTTSNNVVGTIFHAMLEESVNQKHKQYAEINRMDMDSIMKPYMDLLDLAEPKKTVEHQYIEKRMLDAMQESYRFLAEYEKHTSYQPYRTEQYFDEEMIPTVQLHGIVDRINVYNNEFFSIMDYKSSVHKLSDAQILHGTQLQLLTYVIIMTKKLKQQPAGCFYFSLQREDMSFLALKLNRSHVEEVEVTEDKCQEEFIKNRRLQGPTFTDRETELDDTGCYIAKPKKKKTLEEYQDIMEKLYTYFSEELANGNIALDPDINACTFCKCRNVCRYHGSYRPLKPVIEVESEEEDDEI